MDPVIVSLGVIAALVVGVALGFVARGFWGAQAVKHSQEKAARIVADARTQQKELILQAKDEQVRLQREAEEDARAKRCEISGLERRLLQRDEQLDQRADLLEQRDRKLLDRERELDSKRDELVRAREEQVVALERVSQMSAEQAKAQLLEAVRADAEKDAVRLARSIERQAREEAE